MDPPERVTLEDLELYIKLFEKTIARKESFVILGDLRGVKLPPAEVREALGKMQAEFMPQVGSLIVAEANVSNSAVRRGLGALINWVAAPTYRRSCASS